MFTGFTMVGMKGAGTVHRLAHGTQDPSLRWAVENAERQRRETERPKAQQGTEVLVVVMDIRNGRGANICISS